MRIEPFTPIHWSRDSIVRAWRTSTFDRVNAAGRRTLGWKVVTLTIMVRAVGPYGQRDVGVLRCAEFSLALGAVSSELL